MTGGAEGGLNCVGGADGMGGGTPSSSIQPGLNANGEGAWNGGVEGGVIRGEIELVLGPGTRTVRLGAARLWGTMGKFPVLAFAGLWLDAA